MYLPQDFIENLMAKYPSDMTVRLEQKIINATQQMKLLVEAVFCRVARVFFSFPAAQAALSY